MGSSSAKLHHIIMASPSTSTMLPLRAKHIEKKEEEASSELTPKPTQEQLQALREILDDIKIRSLTISTYVAEIYDDKFQQVFDDAQSLKERLLLLQGSLGLAFSGFQRLPTELRCKIWEYATLEPQILAVDHVIYSDSTVRHTHYPKAIIPNGPHAALLQVNRESRAIAQEFLQPYHANPEGIPRVFTNLSLDTIWLINRTEPIDWEWIGDQTRNRFNEGLSILSHPQRLSPRGRSLRKLAFSWKVLMEITEIERARSVNIFGLSFARGQEIYIVIEGNEAANERDIVFRDPQLNHSNISGNWNRESSKIF